MASEYKSAELELGGTDSVVVRARHGTITLVADLGLQDDYGMVQLLLELTPKQSAGLRERLEFAEGHAAAFKAKEGAGVRGPA